MEEPRLILGRHVRQLLSNEIPMDNVLWRHLLFKESTRETKSDMGRVSPHVWTFEYTMIIYFHG